MKPVETIEVTIDSVWQPKPGKKWGNIKTTAGDAFFGPPAMLNLYQKGETCKIEFELGGNDGTLKILKHKIPVPAALARPVPLPPRARTNPNDSEQMFVTALLKSYIEAAAIPLNREAIKKAIGEIRPAYADTFGTPQKQQTEEEVGDSIPY